MPDYTLYYWPLPFRGQFIRATLAHANATWDEAEFDAIAALKNAEVAEQAVPHMAPPVLTDHAANVSMAQMPAILAYLGSKHGLIPDDPERAGLTAKIVADANDVLYEMTRYNGAQMWTQADWSAYRPRLGRWMQLFEETGQRHGLTSKAGYILGGDAPGLADLTAAILWGTMTTSFPPLRAMLTAKAAHTADLCYRILALPAQADLRAKSVAAYGDAWCGGQIEASLRAVL